MSHLLVDWSGNLHILTDLPSKQSKVFAGLPVTIENPKGSTRSGVDSDGTPWSITMTYDYGYIRKTSGMDGDEIDCFLGPNEDAANAYIIRIKNPNTNSPDEDKTMLGFDSAAQAKRAFYQNYTDPDFFHSIQTMPMDDFCSLMDMQKLSEKVTLDTTSGHTGGYILYLLRHAHTPENGDGTEAHSTVRGSLDTEPDEQGIREAKALAEEFKGIQLKKIYTSHKKRAKLVANALSNITGAPVVESASFASWPRGDWEGKPTHEVVSLMEDAIENPDSPVPGGKTYNEFLWGQYAPALRGVMSEVENGNGPIAIVTHHCDLLATPAVVADDHEVRAWPQDKVVTCGLVTLRRKNGKWTWKKHSLLSDLHD